MSHFVSPIAIDFAPPSLARALRRTPVWAWCLGGVGVALCLASALRWQQGELDQSALRAEIALADARLAVRLARAVVKPVLRVPEAQALAVNAVVAQLNLRWDTLLDAMEAASGPTVALLELNIDPRNLWVKGVAQARTSVAMISFVERLKQQPVFDGVTLTRHEFADQDERQPVRFEFEARWQEVSP